MNALNIWNALIIPLIIVLVLEILFCLSRLIVEIEALKIKGEKNEANP